MNTSARNFAMYELSSSAITRGYLAKVSGNPAIAAVITAVTDTVIGVANDTVTALTGYNGTYNCVGASPTFEGVINTAANFGAPLWPAADGRLTTGSFTFQASGSSGATNVYAARPLAYLGETKGASAGDICEMWWA